MRKLASGAGFRAKPRLSRARMQVFRRMVMEVVAVSLDEIRAVVLLGDPRMPVCAAFRRALGIQAGGHRGECRAKRPAGAYRGLRECFRNHGSPMDSV